MYKLICGCQHKLSRFNYISDSMAVVEDLLRPISPLPEEVEDIMLREAALKSVQEQRETVTKAIRETKKQLLLSGVIKHAGTQVEAGDTAGEATLVDANPYSNYIAVTGLEIFRVKSESMGGVLCRIDVSTGDSRQVLRSNENTSGDDDLTH